MAKLTKDLISYIVEKTPCIECGDDIWQAGKMQFFHKAYCQHGLALERDELITRLQRRADEIEQRKIRKEAGTLRCSCGALATGTNWIAYHNLVGIVTAEPSCYQHSIISDDAGRMCGYLPNVISNSVFEVQNYLKTFLQAQPA